MLINRRGKWRYLGGAPVGLAAQASDARLKEKKYRRFVVVPRWTLVEVALSPLVSLRVCGRGVYQSTEEQR